MLTVPERDEPLMRGNAKAYAKRLLADHLRDHAHQFTNNERSVRFDPGPNAVLLVRSSVGTGKTGMRRAGL